MTDSKLKQEIMNQALAFYHLMPEKRQQIFDETGAEGLLCKLGITCEECPSLPGSTM
jgi:hypothetical protein